jgi:hypothetical protein
MDDGRMQLRGTMAHVFLAVLIVGFALALGWALNELDAAVKGTASSLGTIATIGS